MIYSISNFETGKRVNTTARERLVKLRELAPDAHFYVSFSGGKDSTALLMLALETIPHERLHVMFYDLEAETPDTYEFVRKVYKWCQKQCVDFRWNWGNWQVRNATKENGKGLFIAYMGDPWLNVPPYEADKALDYGHKTITYCRDRLLLEYSDHWTGPVISLIGITKFESLHRLLATTKKRKGNWRSLPWTTIQYERNRPSKLIIKAYPIFDWRADDVWGYLQEESPWGLNSFYEKMAEATGLPISKIRTENVLHGCGLKTLPVIEKLYPRFWQRMLARKLIGDSWGNLRAQHTIPREKSDGTQAVEKWSGLL